MLIPNAAPLKQLRKAIDRATRSLVDSTPVFRSMANWVVKDAKRAFRVQGWHGEPWAPLAEATVEGPTPWGPRGRKRGQGNILHPTGVHLLNTIGVLELRRDYARVGTPTPWAHVHNAGAELHGTAFGSITIPRRTFIALDEQSLEAFREILRYYIEGEVFVGW